MQAFALTASQQDRTAKVWRRQMAKARKLAAANGGTAYLFTTYTSICVDKVAPPFGAAHWIIREDGTDSYIPAKGGI